MRALFEAVSDCFDVDFWFHGRAEARPGLPERMKQALPLADKARALAEAFIPENDCEKTSRMHLMLYGEYLTLYTNALIACAEGDVERGQALWDQFAAFLQESEAALQPAMDAYRVQAIARNFFFRK